MLLTSLHSLLSACPFLLVGFLFLPQPAGAETRNLTDTDQGATIQLAQGDKLVVRLNSNASTGYDWYLMKTSTRLLRLESQNQIAPQDSTPGAPGAQVFTFRAKGPGNGDLLLHYVRSWEPPQPDEKTFTVHLTIH